MYNNILTNNQFTTTRIFVLHLLHKNIGSHTKQYLQKSAKYFRDGRVELQLLLSDGMDEGDAAGMEADSADGVGLCAVLEVADHGMADVLHVHTDLVLSACLQTKLNQRTVVGALKGAEVGDGESAALGLDGRGVGHEALVVVEPRADGAAVALHAALDDGLVAAVEDEVLPVVDERFLHIAPLGKEHQSRGVAVETVDGVRGDGTLSAAQVFVEDALDGVFAAIERCIGEDARGLIDDQQEGIFIDDADKLAMQGVQVATAGNLDELSGAQGFVVLGGDDLIDIDHLLRKQLLGAGAVAAGHGRHEEVEQFAGFLHGIVLVVIGELSVVVFLRRLVVVSH